MGGGGGSGGEYELVGRDDYALRFWNGLKLKSNSNIKKRPSHFASFKYYARLLLLHESYCMELSAA